MSDRSDSSERLLLAGDIGATKTNLGLYTCTDGAPARRVAEASFRNADFPHLDDILDQWPGHDVRLVAAGFGIAGPVVDQEVRATNLPWFVSGARLSARLGCPVRLLNDLEATAWATTCLTPNDERVLQEGTTTAGHRCVIAAGTGLGQAMLLQSGDAYVPLATEGGHVDFGPTDEVELELARFLLRKFGRASYERVLSGRGLANLFEFVTQVQGVAATPAVAARVQGEHAGAAVGAAAVAGECPASRAAVGLFSRIYGAQAGNLALVSMSLGGVYVAGGVVLRLGDAFDATAFLDAFRAKAPFTDLMERMRVTVLLDERAPERGAGIAALRWATRH